MFKILIQHLPPHLLSPITTNICRPQRVDLLKSTKGKEMPTVVFPWEGLYLPETIVTTVTTPVLAQGFISSAY